MKEAEADEKLLPPLPPFLPPSRKKETFEVIELD
jgi:hypothetical protein